MIYISKVKEHEGFCICTWRNNSMVDRVTDPAQTGFFRLLRNPFKEFHGAFYKRESDEKTVILSTANH